MRQPPKLHPTGWDGLAALAVVVLAVACAAVVWGGQGTGENLTAVVSVDGEEVERINLESEEGIRSYSGHGLHPGSEPAAGRAARSAGRACRLPDSGLRTHRDHYPGWAEHRVPAGANHHPAGGRFGARRRTRILSLDRRES